jgi:hypothetical protein
VTVGFVHGETPVFASMTNAQLAEKVRRAERGFLQNYS